MVSVLLLKKEFEINFFVSLLSKYILQFQKIGIIIYSFVKKKSICSLELLEFICIITKFYIINKPSSSYF